MLGWSESHFHLRKLTEIESDADSRQSILASVASNPTEIDKIRDSVSVPSSASVASAASARLASTEAEAAFYRFSFEHRKYGSC